MHRVKKISAILLVALVVTTSASLAIAGSFKRTKVMDLKYAWGTTSMLDFDYYDQLYPGYLPIAELTFEPNGTFTAVDQSSGGTGAGIYDKQGRNLEITIVTPSYGSVVQYVGIRVSRGVFEGEILVDGTVQGHWRGTL